MSLSVQFCPALNMDVLLEWSQSVAEEHLCYHHTILRTSFGCFVFNQ